MFRFSVFRADEDIFEILSAYDYESHVCDAFHGRRSSKSVQQGDLLKSRVVPNKDDRGVGPYIKIISSSLACACVLRLMCTISLERKSVHRVERLKVMENNREKLGRNYFPIV